MSAKKPLFELLDHCCSVCGGRILMGPPDDGARQLRCAECGARAAVRESDRSPFKALCYCGVKFANGTDAGLRCRRVDVPTPERPQEMVVRQDAAAERRIPSSSRPPVRVRGDD